MEMSSQATVKWLGHASFQITSPEGKVILIDPWLEGPTSPVKLDDINEAHLVLVTHDHFDHAGDAAEIVKKTGATLVALVETAARYKDELGVPEDKVVYGGFGMNIGGSTTLDGITVTMTQAFHSTATGFPCGYIIALENGKTIYHAGDTGIFDTMRLFGELYGIDLALLPIGGVFTMDPVQAAKAVELLNTKKVIPMHFVSFPILEQDSGRFRDELKKRGVSVEVIDLKPGEETNL
jgi:L-ascorbate metabolism protein UlaG (beta-lactamase superfamily)